MILLGLSAGISAVDRAIQFIFGSCRPADLALSTRALMFSNEEMKDIMKIVKSFEEPVLLMKGISERILDEAK